MTDFEVNITRDEIIRRITVLDDNAKNPVRL